MSASPSNKLGFRLSMAALLAAFMAPVGAAIVIDGNAAKMRSGGVVDGRAYPYSAFNLVSSYPVARSHAWMQSRRGMPVTVRPLVDVPLNGAWMSASTSQFSARAHVARAQAYRMGDRE